MPDRANNLRENIKDWSVNDILWHHCTKWMAFMADKITEKELMEDREICTEAIEDRF